jgi:hypothetical protein
MSHLKSLTFTVSPQQIARNPKLIRRQKLVDRLEDQLRLAKDPSYAPLIRRWKRSEDGHRSPVDLHRQIRPWWRTDGSGNLVLVLRSGLKTLELEKGKPAVELDAASEAAIVETEQKLPKRRTASI